MNRLERACRIAILCIICTLPVSETVLEAGAQTLLTRYVQLRTRHLARRTLDSAGALLTPLPPDPLSFRSDSIRAWILSLKQDSSDAPPPIAESFVVASSRFVSRLERDRYVDRFNSTEWAFLGTTGRGFLDTTRTQDLRSRLETVFGHPTTTLSESGYPERLPTEEILEFEFWILLNDSIPVIVMDLNGPWDRGLVIAAEYLYRDHLDTIKTAFLEQLLAESIRSAFVDYYYNPQQDQWYVTGFDGASFFDRRIGRPNLSLGRPNPNGYIQ